MTLADRIAIMNHGELQQVGEPTEVYHNPANVFVADFIGSPNINLFDVDLIESADGGTLRNEAFDYEISRDLLDAIDAEDGAELVLGVRPENMEIASDSGGELESRVEVVETVGSDNFLYTRVGDQECRVRTSSTIIPEQDDILRLTFDEDDIYLFDRGTEERVFDRGKRYERRRELLQ